MKQKMTPAARKLGWAYYGFQLLVLPSLLTELGLGDAQTNFIYYLINFAACAVIFRGFLRTALTQAGKSLGRVLPAVVVGFVLYYGASRAFSMLVPDFSNVNDQAVTAMLRAHPVLMFLGLVCLVPLAEECFYRGLMFTQIRKPLWGCAISTLAFAAVHVVGYVGRCSAGTLALCFLQYIPAGLILAGSCRFTGTIFAPILIHTAVNAAAFIELY